MICAGNENALQLKIHVHVMRHSANIPASEIETTEAHKVAVPISVQISDVPSWDAEFFFNKFERSAKLVQEQL